MPDPSPRTDGPHGMFALDRPPSRGQWASIAALALQAVGLDVPTTRRDASIAIARLQIALERADDQHPPMTWAA